LLGANVLEHSKYFYLELFNLIPGKNRAANASHPGLNLVQRKKINRRQRDCKQTSKTANKKALHSYVYCI
jgi:hypothetical protein